MTAPQPMPVEYGEVLGYALAIWPRGDLAQYPISQPEVVETVVEARAMRAWARPRADLDLRIVEIREVVVE